MDFYKLGAKKLNAEYYAFKVFKKFAEDCFLISLRKVVVIQRSLTQFVN
jgi:hypothetical protein